MAKAKQTHSLRGASGYPLPAFHYQVHWGDGSNSGFQEVSGLTAESEPIEYREGNSPEFSPRKMPGLMKYGNLTLKRGVFVGNQDFWQWFKTIQLHTVERRDIVISILNEQHEPVVSYGVRNAWPTKVSGPVLHAQRNEVAIETMVVAHEGIDVIN